MLLRVLGLVVGDSEQNNEQRLCGFMENGSIWITQRDRGEKENRWRNDV